MSVLREWEGECSGEKKAITDEACLKVCWAWRDDGDKIVCRQLRWDEPCRIKAVLATDAQNEPTSGRKQKPGASKSKWMELTELTGMSTEGQPCGWVVGKRCRTSHGAVPVAWPGAGSEMAGASPTTRRMNSWKLEQRRQGFGCNAIRSDGKATSWQMGGDGCHGMRGGGKGSAHTYTHTT